MSDYVWGVDVASRKVAIAAHPEIGGKSVTAGVCVTKERDEATRLADLYRTLHSDAADLAELYPPLVIWVERPTGSFPNPSLDHAVGVVLGALWDALKDTYLHPVPVHLVSVGEWKKAALGFGNASKSQVLAWARARGYDGDDQDVADAWAIAYAGSQLTTWERAA